MLDFIREFCRLMREVREQNESVGDHADNCLGVPIMVSTFPPIAAVMGCTCGRGRK